MCHGQEVEKARKEQNKVTVARLAVRCLSGYLSDKAFHVWNLKWVITCTLVKIIQCVSYLE